ncbi:MAG: Cys-tRNA(Pro) deacylase [Propionibacteriaceae bacterium]|jgi:Cys-tRNA(Pro)/Cys-tRNA(Cys) deacylase|nr:Cys-tRNA(Pro) deacylase [Propionibacteriaceae bacterium]
MGVGTPATVALSKAGIAFQVREYDHDPSNHDYGREAARALGVDELRVFKTLVVDTGSGLAVAVVPVAGMLDTKAMARELGVKRVELADPKAAQHSSGFVVGGISPIGQKNPLPTLIDETAQIFDTVLVSGGRRGMDIELAPDDLALATQGRFADIAA